MLIGSLAVLVSSPAGSKCTEPKGNAVTVKQYYAWEDCVKRELDKEEADRKASQKKADAFKEPSKKTMISNTNLLLCLLPLHLLLRRRV